MASPDRPPSFDDLDARLKKARGGDRPAPPSPHVAAALGWRLAIEMAAGMAVGGIIGWFLDTWLGSRPWLTLVLVLFGVAAGVRNAYRLTQKRSAGPDQPTGA